MYQKFSTKLHFLLKKQRLTAATVPLTRTRCVTRAAHASDVSGTVPSPSSSNAPKPSGSQKSPDPNGVRTSSVVLDLKKILGAGIPVVSLAVAISLVFFQPSLQNHSPCNVFVEHCAHHR